MSFALAFRHPRASTLVALALLGCGESSPPPPSGSGAGGSGGAASSASASAGTGGSGASAGEGGSGGSEPSSFPIAERPNAPKLMVEHLADPEIYKESDDLFLLSGTGSTVDLPIYESKDLESFSLRRVYDPSVVDPAHDYCHLWAPDLSKHEGTYVLFFSAHRVKKGAACPPPPGLDQEETTFFATAPDLALEFGPPQVLDLGGGAPRTKVSKGCPADGCDRVVRIDAAVFGEGADRRLFYVWFFPGNNISSFPFSSPASVTGHTGKGIFPAHAVPLEQDVNEGPDVILRDGRYYLFYSTGWFTQHYAMHYIMGASPTDLTRARAARRLSRPVQRANGKFAGNAGHNAVTTRNGEHYNFFHVGHFDPEGNLVARHTYRQRLDFKPDGSLVSANEVFLRWTRIPGRNYSLDVRLRDGSWVGPCVDAGILGDSASTVFTGICPGAGDRLVHKSDVVAFRLFHSEGSSWSEFVEVPYDGLTDDVFFDLPGGLPDFVSLSWNELETGTEYSLDVRKKDGTWVAPCAGDSVLGRGIAHDFDGTCPSAGGSVPLSDVAAFRVCSAKSDDWANARCGEAAWDGRAMRLELSIP